MSTDAEYPVGIPAADAPAAAQVSAAERLRRGAPRSIVGRSLLSPFTRDGKNDFANGEGVTLVNSMIVEILGTRATSGVAVGELPWRSGFGSWLYLLRHSSNDELTEAIAQQYVVDAVGLWLPRVEITSTEVERQSTNGTLDTLSLVIKWRLLRTRGSADVRFSGTARVPIPRAA